MDYMDYKLKKSLKKALIIKCVLVSFCMISSFLSLYLFSQEPTIERRPSSTLSDICEFYSELKSHGLESLGSKDNTSFCNDYEKYKDFIDAAYSSSMIHNSEINWYFIPLMLFVLMTYVFGLSSFVNIPSDFDLNESETFLFRWIEGLKRTGILKHRGEFDSWISGFESRYSERELEIMKLNFKIDA